MFLLVDCNNFFVSCERVFRPELQHAPVAVLSNNDGCIVSRSNEVKALGIPMGAPVFKWRERIAQHRIITFSGNFALYGDLSQRVMSTVAHFSDRFEPYSIDEAFIEVHDFSRTQLLEYAHEMRNTIRAWTGIPVSVGIGPTKTLAKAANKIAKSESTHENVFALCTPQEIDNNLAALPVRDIWGVGRALERFLHDYNITTAKQLADAPDSWIKKQMHMNGLHLAWELRGIPCGGVEAWAPRKGILSSRSFGRPVATLAELKQSVAHHISFAAEKLRAQGSAANYVQVFIMTNRFKLDTQQYSCGKGILLAEPSAYTPTLIQAAHNALTHIYKPGFHYKKAGIWLADFVPDDRRQSSLFGTAGYSDRQQRLMHAQDVLNKKWGSRTVHTLATGVTQRWRAKQEQRSPRYTTVWEELPNVRA